MILILLFSLFVCGVVTTLAGFIGLLYPWVSVLFILPLFLVLSSLFISLRKISRCAKNEKILVILLSGIWLIHFCGVLVPETGFDALWYHLPVAQAFIQAHRFYSIPELYQSLNPYFSDSFFALGFQSAGVFGSKCVAYMFGVILVLLTYALSRLFMNRAWALATVIIISSFQVVAWQASSFYVDIAHAVWQIGALYVLIRYKEKWWSSVFTGLFFGASLATKVFSLFLLPLFFFVRMQKKALFFISALSVVAPFYVFTYLHSGNPLYSLGIHVGKLNEIGGSPSLLTYLFERTLQFPSSLTQLTLFSRDYTSLIFFVFFPLFFLSLNQLRKNPDLKLLLFFSGIQWLFWWYIPPLSTRYALSGFITLAILSIWTLENYVKQKPEQKNSIVLALGIAVFFNLLPRLIPLRRQGIYIFRHQSNTEYIRQFYDGSIDQHLNKWYLHK